MRNLFLCFFMVISIAAIYAEEPKAAKTEGDTKSFPIFDRDRIWTYDWNQGSYLSTYKWSGESFTSNVGMGMMPCHSWSQGDFKYNSPLIFAGTQSMGTGITSIEPTVVSEIQSTTGTGVSRTKSDMFLNSGATSQKSSTRIVYVDTSYSDAAEKLWGVLEQAAAFKKADVMALLKKEKGKSAKDIFNLRLDALRKLVVVKKK